MLDLYLLADRFCVMELQDLAIDRYLYIVELFGPDVMVRDIEEANMVLPPNCSWRQLNTRLLTI
jgi:hypothetical protein